MKLFLKKGNSTFYVIGRSYVQHFMEIVLFCFPKTLGAKHYYYSQEAEFEISRVTNQSTRSEKEVGPQPRSCRIPGHILHLLFYIISHGWTAETLIWVIILKFLFFEIFLLFIGTLAWALQDLIGSHLYSLALWPDRHFCQAVTTAGLWEAEAKSFCFGVHFCWLLICLCSRFPTASPCPSTLDSMCQAPTCFRFPPELLTHLVSFSHLIITDSLHLNSILTVASMGFLAMTAPTALGMWPSFKPSMIPIAQAKSHLWRRKIRHWGQWIRQTFKD